MSRPIEKRPVKWLTIDELDREISNRRIQADMLRKLLFIRLLYHRMGVPQASSAVGVSKVAGYIWLKEWNENGLEGLKPNYAGGRPSKLSSEQKKELKTILIKRDDWTTKEIRQLIEEKFSVSYSLRNVERLLRDMGMKYGKPYQHDYRRPKDAEEKLKKTK